MNVLFFLHGVLAYSIGLGKALEKNNINMMMYSPSFFSNLKIGGCNIRNVSYNTYETHRMYSRCPPLLKPFLYFPLSNSIVKKCDIIHINGDVDASLTSFAKRVYGKPSLCTIHDPYPNKRWLKLFKKNNTPIVVPSYFMKRRLKEKFDVNAQVVHHGVDLDLFSPKVSGNSMREHLGIGREEQLILWVSRMDPIKDPLTFIKSIKYILEVCDNSLKFVLTAPRYKGPLYDQVVSLLRNLGFLGKKVFLVTGIPYVRMPEIYAACDVFVHTARMESFGLVLIEAMACGKSVIAPNSSSMPEIIGNSGLLYAPRDSKDLANKINFLISDESKRIELGRKARSRVMRKFTWKKAATKYLTIYKTLSRS